MSGVKTSRRDFMKVFGAGVASILLVRCKLRAESTPTEVFIGCYMPTAVPWTPTPPPPSAYIRLRSYWLRFDEVAGQAAAEGGSYENTLGEQLIADHRAALDELEADGELTRPVADLVQEAYAAAVQHVWRSSIPVTCYIAAGPMYYPESAGVLLEQARVLRELGQASALDPSTLAKARAALEHDLAFYALTEEDVQQLYAGLQASGQPYPGFEQLTLEITPDARTAAQFILDLLSAK